MYTCNLYWSRRWDIIGDCILQYIVLVAREAVLKWSECGCSMQICNLCVCVHNVEPPASTAYLATSTNVPIPCYYIATTVHLLTLLSVKGSLYLPNDGVILQRHC